jgi:hypothetical protein
MASTTTVDVGAAQQSSTTFVAALGLRASVEAQDKSLQVAAVDTLFGPLTIGESFDASA